MKILNVHKRISNGLRYFNEVFNEAEWLEKTYKSIKFQKLKPNKVIFVDSGSDDDSVKLAEKLIGM